MRFYGVLDDFVKNYIIIIVITSLNLFVYLACHSSGKCGKPIYMVWFVLMGNSLFPYLNGSDLG
jgi:hypothetical protein